MPALFSALEDRLSGVTDKYFGEDFDFLPMRQATVNSRSTPDDQRLGLLFQAVLDDRNPGAAGFARLGKTSGGAASSSGTPMTTTSNPMLFFDGAVFGADLPRRLDRVRRTDTGDTYEITNREQDGQGRYKCALVKVARD